ncbi:hypothetical protein I7I53_05226 [Histoplasma capsulatum var. duboisii H88]|uniref:Uncharacterized protein n=1 Tax=Ajellomyces capsulatus (strain H88) TaxID=544711 RepID=A0A8A1LUM9_AJEC8|nr:hypothetical protein I7I53_05226 [Histoplasma capsulatum var. duboisii H88]
MRILACEVNGHNVGLDGRKGRKRRESWIWTYAVSFGWDYFAHKSTHTIYGLFQLKLLYISRPQMNSKPSLLFSHLKGL